jgi:hypothetical protein
MPSVVRADAIANAVIKWDTWRVSYLPMAAGPVEFKWVDSTKYGEVVSEAETADPLDNQVDSDVAYDFSTAMVADVVTSKAQAMTVRNESVLSTNAASQSGLSASASDWNFADSYVYQHAEFTLSGNGVAVVSVDWYADVTGVAGNMDEYARASIWGYAGYLDGLNEGGATTSIDLYSYDIGDDSLSGTFTFTVTNLSGAITTGEFYMDAWSYAKSANVPEPASCVLMGLGLGAMGLVGYRRRASKNKSRSPVRNV